MSWHWLPIISILLILWVLAAWAMVRRRSTTATTGTPAPARTWSFKPLRVALKLLLTATVLCLIGYLCVSYAPRVESFFSTTSVQRVAQAYVPTQAQQQTRSYTVQPGEWTGWIEIPPRSAYNISASHEVQVETYSGTRYELRNGSPLWHGTHSSVRDAYRRYSPIAGATEAVTITVTTEPR